jgi:hypothetical protein
LINAGRIEEKLVDKVDTNASNFTTGGKSLISGYGMPTGKFINLTLGASGSSYTAPANGWVTVSSNNSGSYPKSIEIIAVVGAHSYAYSADQSGYLRCYAPVRKNETFSVYYSNMSLDRFRFHYAEGEQ